MKTLSVILPAFNEEKNIDKIYSQLIKQGSSIEENLEIIFINDGSSDATREVIKSLTKSNKNVVALNFSRNFGKEIAVTAGINNCSGDAAIIMDCDGQHPADKIPEFIKLWKEGNKVVVGVRKSNSGEGIVKRAGSKYFYMVMSKIAKVNIIPGSTDFRLIDREVIEEFNRFTERNRITRGLIDWMGYRRDYVYFDANARIDGEAGYTFRPLLKLAMNSFVSLSLFPLKLSGYLGILITTIATLIGLFILIENYLLGDPMGLNISGSASLAVMIIFLVGILLMSQGLVSLYIAHIYDEVTNRPIYIIEKDEKSGK